MEVLDDTNPTMDNRVIYDNKGNKTGVEYRFFLTNSDNEKFQNRMKERHRLHSAACSSSIQKKELIFDEEGKLIDYRPVSSNSNQIQIIIIITISKMSRLII
jgi:hypothetical protein